MNDWYYRIEFDFCDYEGSKLFTCLTKRLKEDKIEDDSFGHSAYNTINLPYRLKKEKVLLFKDLILHTPTIIKFKDGENTPFLKICGSPKLDLLFLESKMILTYDYTLGKWVEDNSLFLYL